MVPGPDPRLVATQVKQWALDAGFDRAGVATLEPLEHGDAFVRWLERGEHAGMGYLERRVEGRLVPATILDGATTVLCVALRYAPLAGEDEPEGDLWPGVARYARGRDYHALMEERLDAVAARVTATFPHVRSRRYVDTGPVLERELAARAGIGVVGKNTCLLDREMGSWFLLGELFLTLELTADEPLAELCGGCTLCLEACPTGALVEPYRLDSNLCISYWTIEHRGALPGAAADAAGPWVFGCDICQDVCPWNRRRHTLPAAEHDELRLPPARKELDLAGLLSLGREGYVERFRGSSMKRARLPGLQRNAATAMGNSREPRHVPALAAALADNPDPAVRGAAAHALGRIGGVLATASLERALPREADAAVRREIAAGLDAGEG